VVRELVLNQGEGRLETRSEIMQICDIFRAKIVHVAHDQVIVETTGDDGKVNAFSSCSSLRGARLARNPRARSQADSAPRSGARRRRV